MSDHGAVDSHIAANLSQWSSDTSEVFLRILVACLIGPPFQVLSLHSVDHGQTETVTFHAGVVFASYIVLGFSDWIGSWKSFRSNEVSGIRQQFKVSHIPLAIIYSSFTKSFLLFLLTIWRPSISLPGNGPYRFDAAYENPWILSALEIWDEDKLDREWVVRNVLGGMAAGFGLRGR
ncbi:hypothetical protein JVT61DRAFT_14121 [Boletus reticuloceps]|uniref:Uncharacterized protein n=1 Tax=Boletus reticuloceps TaxID=495285 RepID=A0A8I3A3J4_9AGAM|nr:hypothetical protein JVT61DRAFT_14121 [Boletus reticuloceps]